MHSTVRNRTWLSRWSLPDVVGLGGGVAGLLAGFVMVLISPLLSIITGISIWEPPKLIAASVLGSAALDQPGFGLTPVLTGALIHFVVSILLGIVFGIVSHRLLHLTTDFGLPIYAGLCYGLLIFFVAYFLILPAVNPALVESDTGMGPILAQNIVFGMCLGIFYTLVRPQPYRNTREQV